MKNMMIPLMGLLCLALTVQAQQKPLDMLLTVNYKNTPLSEVIADLQQRYGIEFTYSNSDLNLKQPLTLVLTQKPAKQVFNKLFNPLNINYYEVGSTIVLKIDAKHAELKGEDGKDKMVTISGFVREKATLESMPGTTIYIPALQYGAQSNNYGFYSLTIPQGNYEVVYSFIGFKKVSDTLSITNSLKHDVFIEQSNILKEVVISADKPIPASQDPRMSTVDISMADVKRMPALLGEKDLFKVIQLYPGVQRNAEGTSGYYVRGGTADQNLVILDDAPVYNANHAFGLFSVFNGEAIKSAELIKGGFPARYGDRLSSVLVMNMKDGNKERLAGEFGIGLISSHFTLEGPIQKGKSSFLISGRRSYGDLLLKPFLKKSTNAGYYFYDLNAKVNTEIDKNNHLYLSAYLGKDKIYGSDNDDGYKTGTDLGWGNQTVTSRWNHVFSDKIFGNASLIFSNYKLKTTYNDMYENTKSSRSYTSAIRDIGLKYDLDYALSHEHTLRIGARTVAHHFEPNTSSYTGPTQYQNPQKVQSLNSWENNLYAEDTWTVSDRVSVNAGIRANAFSTQGSTYFNVEPRISTRVLLNNSLAVKASYSKMDQYLNLLSNGNLGLPTDLWVPATKNIPPQRSEQFALGIAKDFKDQKYAFTIEGYYKKMNNLVAYKDGASFINVNFDEYANTSNNFKTISWEDNITSGKGKSTGIEMLFEKKKGRFTGWLGYTLSFTKFQFNQINGGESYRPAHDRRHNLTAVGIYDINNHIKLSFSWTYLSGSPITIAQSDYSVITNGPTGDNTVTGGVNSSPNNLTDYSKKGAFKTDAYNRLDVGIQFIKQKKHGIRTWDISLYNAYNKFNPFYYYYSNGYGDNNKFNLQLKKKAYLPIVPSITYSYKF